MTNLDKIKQMDVDELAEWLTGQIWPEYTKINQKKVVEYMLRYHMVRNFLLEEYEEEEGDKKDDIEIVCSLLGSI